MFEKANMLLLTEETTEKDRSFKTKLLDSTNSQPGEKINGEQIWKKNGFFDMKELISTLKRNFFSRKCSLLCKPDLAINLSTVNGGELAIYNHNFFLGQFAVATNQPENIDEYVCENYEVKPIAYLYDQSTSEFLGLNLQLVYILLRGDIEESFFSYGYMDSAAKDRMPNAIISTCFKKHFHEIMSNRRHNEELPGLIYYLTSITDCEEKVNQYHDNVNLNLTDCSLELLSSFSHDKVDFKPHLSSSSVVKKRDPRVELLYNFYRQMAATSNANLIGNADYLLASCKQDDSKIVWVGSTKQRYGTTKFKLTN